MMMNYEVIEKQMYDKALNGGSYVSGDLVEIIGEQKVRLEDDRVVEQYLYNIVGYTPSNGKPFVALKANLAVF